MSYKLKAYRVAGGAACPEAIIFYLLLYALLYILKHETWDGRVAANELHEILHAMKPREALLRFLSKLSMSSLHLLMPPRAAYATHSMGPASLRDALALSTSSRLYRRQALLEPVAAPFEAFGSLMWLFAEAPVSTHRRYGERFIQSIW